MPEERIRWKLEGPYVCCVFISIGILSIEMMSLDANSMMMRVIMGSMTVGVLLTSEGRYKVA